MPSPVTALTGLLALGLIALFLTAAFIAALALSRSSAGRWLLGAGAVLLAVVFCMLGMYFVVFSVRDEIRRPAVVREVAIEGQVLSQTEAAPSAASASPVGAEKLAAETPAEKSPSAPRPGAGRPAWMDAPMGRDGDVYRTIATAGPYSTAAECNEKLPEALEEAVHHYIERLLGADASRRVRLPLAFIHERIVRGEWLEQAEFSFGPMYNLHQRLEFDASAAREIERRYRASLVASRVNYTGASAALALGLVAVFFSYFKLDTLTRGYYTGRLRVAAGAVILAEAAIVGLLVNGNIGF